MAPERQPPGFLTGCVAGTALWGVLAAIAAGIALTAGWVGDEVSGAVGGAGPGDDRAVATALLATIGEEYFVAQQMAYVAGYKNWSAIDPESLPYAEQQKREEAFREWQGERDLIARRFREHLERTARTCEPAVLGFAIVEAGTQGKARVVLSSASQTAFNLPPPPALGRDAWSGPATFDGQAVVAHARVLYDRFSTGEPRTEWTAYVFFAGE